MKAASTPRAIEIFNDALDVAAGKRAVFLADACGSDETLSGEVESLLDAHDRAAGAAFLAAPNVDRLQSLTEKMLSTPSLVGQRVGPYRVIESIGEGGMGVVYRAEQDHPRRFVALKVMRPGIVNQRMLRRFKREVEVLGRLQHPGIARIYDAGVAELPGGTQPYFAMELVTGRPLTTWADAEGLDSRARLALMALVCDAVQHAHQHGVVHRDLKPGNILVGSSGEPKVLDFGVARATDSDTAVTTLHTDVRDLVGTLQYMSPEQCDADPDNVDTRSDVYSLGVICYELLAGSPPYSVADKSLATALNAIRETMPRPLSSVNRVFRGDVATIVSKALEKDPMWRYQSASEFGADIRRYLAHEPISARRPSTVYQVGRFARRNRVLVGGVAATIIVLCAGIVTTGFEARAARAEAHKRGIALEFMSKSGGKAESFFVIPGNEQLLDRVVASLDFDMTPQLEAQLHNHIGEVYTLGGHYEKAEPHTRRQLELHRAVLGPAHTQTLRAVQIEAELLNALGRYEDARSLLTATIDEVGDRSSPDQWPIRFRLLRIDYTLGGALYGLGRLDEAEALYRRTLEQQELESRLTPSDAIETTVALATLLSDRSTSLAEAEELLRDGLQRRIEFSGRYDEHAQRIHWKLGRVLLARRQLTESRQYLAEAYQWYIGKKGDRHPVTIAILVDRARLLQYEGRPQEARSAFEQVLRIARETKLAEWRIAEYQVHYGSCLGVLGDLAAARKELSDAHGVLAARFGASDYRARRAERALSASQ